MVVEETRSNVSIHAWFLSDLHLKDPKERNSQTLLRFFNSVLTNERPMTHLFLVGDIFDVWIGGHKVFQDQWSEIVSTIKSLKSRGVEIYYFEGNHDVHIDHFWQKELGIPVYTSPRYFKLGELNVRVEHGDLINLEDATYLRYRNFIRSAPLRAMGVYLPGKFWGWVGNKMSSESRKHSQVYREEQVAKLKQMHREHAERAFREKRFDLLVTGHLHVDDDYQLPGQKARAINLGSWFGEAKALHLSLTDLRVERI